MAAAEFAAPRSGFFPSIRATLNHNLTVDWYYVDAIERSLARQAPNDAARDFLKPEQPFAECAALRDAQRACDERLVAVCAALDAPQLAREIAVPRAAGVVAERLDRLLAHLFQHQTHHRGQAHAMLSSTPVAPPQLDEFFCAGCAPRSWRRWGWTRHRFGHRRPRHTTIDRAERSARYPCVVTSHGRARAARLSASSAVRSAGTARGAHRRPSRL